MRKDIEAEATRISEQLNDLTALIVRFYATLGAKNWVFPDYLSTKRLEGILDTESPDIAEERLLEYFQEKETLPGMITLLNSLPRHEATNPIAGKSRQRPSRRTLL